MPDSPSTSTVALVGATCSMRAISATMAALWPRMPGSDAPGSPSSGCQAILHGGLQAWKAANLPLSTEVPAIERRVFTPRRDDSLMVTWQQMRDAVGDPNIVKLDTRARDEWEGESSSPSAKDVAPRKGRIPGAVWIDWLHMMERKSGIPRFRSREEILDICRRVGIGPESRVYLYCFKGARAANTLVALREAGIRDVRLYFGSWNEWARNPELPIEEGPPVKQRIAPIDGAGLDALAEKGKANRPRCARSSAVPCSRSASGTSTTSARCPST
ncbi:MAG TPA: rhodanese-like domain-containing protein [Haliangium sp.]|nr:rhodanese-like domain-containing protein [Haliangium sp.]